MSLKGKRIAVLVADGFEKIELTEPVKALKKEGAEINIVSLERGTVKSWNNNDWDEEFSVDVIITEAEAKIYDALVLPGGVMNPDKLRTHQKAIEFVKSIYQNNKPIAAICHGPWILIDAKIVKDTTLTSWPSLKNDLRNAGANWIDQEVVIDNNILTSRKPADIPEFNKWMINMFAGTSDYLEEYLHIYENEKVIPGEGNRDFDDPVMPNK